MQGLPSVKLATCLFTPLIGACESPYVLLSADRSESLLTALNLASPPPWALTANALLR